MLLFIHVVIVAALHWLLPCFYDFVVWFCMLVVFSSCPFAVFVLAVLHWALGETPAA
jgi:hypothetical protein